MTAMSSRFGLRALVTRPRAEAAGLADALASRGIEAILEPMLDIHYRDAPAPDLAGVQAILCTSANGVRALARLSPERGCALLAVGESTAGRARAEGFLQIESAGGNVADLARLVRRRLWPDQGRLLHVAGTEIAGDLAGDLGASGFEVQRAVLYEARPAVALSAGTARALASGIVDFALFFSSRTAAALLVLIAAILSAPFWAPSLSSLLPWGGAGPDTALIQRIERLEAAGEQSRQTAAQQGSALDQQGRRIAGIETKQTEQQQTAAKAAAAMQQLEPRS